MEVCQMHIFKLLAALSALTFCNLALGQTTFVCGSVACSAFGNLPITGIDNLVVDGDHFNMAFSNTQDSTFAFSNYVSAAGKPLTGVDAANAINAFYATQQGPIPQDDGPGISALVGGVVVEIFNITTAFQATSRPGVFNVDFTEPFLGFPYHPVIEANQPNGEVVAVSGISIPCVGGCTVWKPVAAPEISTGSTTAALTLLLGSLAVMRGRRIDGIETKKRQFKGAMRANDISRRIEGCELVHRCRM
jgi:hypothetical protein